MGFNFRHWSLRKRVAVLVGVVLPCVLFWSAWEAGSWRPRLLFEDAIVQRLVFSPTEPLLACTLGDHKGTVLQVWNSRQKKMLWSQQDRSGYGQVEFSPDGKMVAPSTWGITVDRATAVTLWDSHTGKKLKTLEEPRLKKEDKLIQWSENPFQFSPDSQRVLIVEQKLRFYDVATGRPVETLGVPNISASSGADAPLATPFADQDHYIEGLTVFPDTKHVGIYLWNGKLWMCDLRGRFPFEFQRPCVIAALSPDSHWMATYFPTTDGILQLKLWDVWTRKPIRRISAPASKNAMGIGSVGFSSDGTRFFGSITEKTGQATVVIWEVPSGRVLHTFHPTQTYFGGVHLALSADNAQMAVSGAKVTATDTQYSLQLWRVK